MKFWLCICVLQPPPSTTLLRQVGSFDVEPTMSGCSVQHHRINTQQQRTNISIVLEQHGNNSAEYGSCVPCLFSCGANRTYISARAVRTQYAPDGIFKANFPNLYTACVLLFCNCSICGAPQKHSVWMGWIWTYTREQLVNNVWIIQKLCGCGTPYNRVFQISMFEVKCGIEFKWSSLGFLFRVFKCWSQNGNDKLFIY